MCSIVGLQGKFKCDDLIKMLKASKNRGPDSTDIYLGDVILNIDLDDFRDDNDYEIAFSHNLLDVYDLYDRKSMPQPVKVDNLVLVLNGALYKN